MNVQEYRMDIISLKKLKNKYVLTITDNSCNIIRKVTLVKEQEYVLNPINNRYDKNRGRKVIFRDIEPSRYGSIAKITYLDTLRPGKVQIDDLDYINTETHKLKPIANQTDSFIYEEVVPLFQLYLDILNVIEHKKDINNVAYITQKEIAENVSTSPTNVSKRLKQLIRYGAIQSVTPGAYKIISNSIWNTPYRIVHRVMSLVSGRPELEKQYKEQAIVLDVSLDDISQAWSYINVNRIDKTID